MTISEPSHSDALLRVLILSDGIPGHVNQSRGLARWIQQRRRTNVTEVEIRLKRKLMVRVFGPWALRLGRPGRDWLLRQYQGLPAEVNADLIISAGGATSFANAALSQSKSLRNIFIGSLRKLSPSSFDARIALEPGKHSDAIVVDIAPTRIRPVRSHEERTNWRRTLNITDDGTLYCVLIGGNGSGYTFYPDDWRQLASLLTEQARNDGARLLLSTSRRTGAAGETILKQLIPQELLASAVWWSENPEKIVENYLGSATRVILTADSMSMMAEAISSGNPVTSLTPETSNPDTRHLEALQRMEQAGYLSQSRLSEKSIRWPASPKNIASTIDVTLDALEKQLGLAP